jgi:hypothetical protein
MRNVFQLFAGWPLKPDGTASRLSQHKVNCLPHRASIHQALSHSGAVVDKRLKPRQFKIRRIKTCNANVFFGKLLGQFSGETTQTLFTGKKAGCAMEFVKPGMPQAVCMLSSRQALN